MHSSLLTLAALALLTGNAKNPGLGEDCEKLGSGANISWISEGEEATDEHFIRSASTATGRSRLLDGGVSGNSMVYGPWRGGVNKATFVVDLKEEFLVRRIVLWSVEQKGRRGCSSFVVSLSSGGKKFVPVARYENPSDCDRSSEFEGGNVSVPLSLELERLTLARYVKISATQHAGRHQMILGEVAILGDPVPSAAARTAYLPEKQYSAVVVSVDAWGSGAATLSWKDPVTSAGLEKWRVYRSHMSFEDVRKEGVACIGEVPAEAREYCVYPLQPGVTNHYAVTAVYASGEVPRVNSVKLSTVGPLSVKTFRDMLGYNYYWGGGGANSKTKAYYDVAADFLADVGIRKIRWWTTPERIIRDEYLRRGVEVCGRDGDKAVALRYGLYLRGIGNEPELTSMTPEECVARFRKSRAAWADVDGGCFKVYGPAVGIYDKGFDYFKAFIEAGGADCVDVFDFHDYCGRTAEFQYPTGYPVGSPEAIIPRVAQIREFLRTKNIDKPLMCSEWGYSDAKTNNPHMDDPTPLRKAQFLVRGCILHHVLDFRRLYVYSFYDEGYDSDFSEHTFGVVSRDCQKKPAYYAVKNMVSVLGDFLYNRPVEGMREGDFGYLFAKEGSQECLAAVWNGAIEKTVVFKTRAAQVEVVSLFGESRTVRPDANGLFRVDVGPSVTYLKSDIGDFACQ